jgi:hypothetical protein
MHTIRAELVSMISDKIGVDESEVTDDIDINRGLGCTGDEFHELMEEFAMKFNVDMTVYRWYFHTEEEGFGSIGSWFFEPPNERVQHIPVNVRVLLEAASSHKWPMIYPHHEIPKRRWDLTINLVFLIVVVAWAMVSLVKC